MCKNNKHKEEENESLHTHSNFEGLFNLFHDIALVSKDFQNSQQLGQFDELVHPADPCESDYLVHIRPLENNLEGDYCYEVDGEPASKVVLGNLLAILLKLKTLTQESCVKDDEYVDGKKYVLNIIYGLPSLVTVIDEGNLVWCHQARK